MARPESNEQDPVQAGEKPGTLHEVVNNVESAGDPRGSRTKSASKSERHHSERKTRDH